MQVWTNDHVDYAIADSAEGALRAWCDQVGENFEDYAETIEAWEPLDDDQSLTIWCDDVDGSISQIEGDEGSPVRLSAVEWVARRKPGFLCSRER